MPSIPSHILSVLFLLKTLAVASRTLYRLLILGNYSEKGKLQKALREICINVGYERFALNNKDRVEVEKQATFINRILLSESFDSALLSNRIAVQRLLNILLPYLEETE